MRTTKGFLAGLGTTGSMVGGALCVFVVFSAVVAFNGWPGAASHHGSRNLSIKASHEAAWDVSGARTVALAAAPAAATVVAHPAGPVVSPLSITSPKGGAQAAALGSRSAPGAPGQPAGTPPASSSSEASSHPSQGIVHTPDVTSQSNAAASAVEGATSNAGQTAGSTGHGAGSAVSGVSPAAGQTVSHAGDTAGGAANSAGQTLGQVVRGLGPK